MYDGDLRVWYRELFLSPSPRTNPRRRSGSVLLRPAAADHPARDADFPVRREAQRLSDHEFPQTSH